MSGLRLRCAKHLTRQAHVEDRSTPRQASEPSGPPPALLPAPALHQLRKHNSYPQFAPRNRRPRSAVLLAGAAEQRMGSLLIRAVSVAAPTGASPPEGPPPAPAPFPAPVPATVTPRASHTPAVRSGPPLSCNFCWNTVDECGRILRRKTQYHCPECRTNLCIVPCFHEYHEAENELASAR